MPSPAPKPQRHRRHDDHRRRRLDRNGQKAGIADRITTFRPAAARSLGLSADARSGVAALGQVMNALHRRKLEDVQESTTRWALPSSCG
jgi:hypothetical protein